VWGMQRADLLREELAEVVEVRRPLRPFWRPF
jgi:hypothetical protein